MFKVRLVGGSALVLVVAALLGGCGWLFPSLNAVLVANPTSGVAPLSVQFDLSGSTGQIVSFSLNFGDGSGLYTGTNITVPVLHTYSAAGTYVATLTVQGPGGQIDTDQVTITVSAPPPGTTVSLGALPASGDAPLTVVFWANIAAAPGRRIKHIALDYDGDGTPDDGAGVDFETWNFIVGSHTYGDPGQFVAKLTVTDDSTPPQTFLATATVNVTSPPPTITSFTADLGGAPVVTFDFSAEAGPGRNIVEWTIDYGDGSSYTQTGLSTPTLTVTGHPHTYAAGDYTVILTVKDDAGQTDTATLDIIVP